MPLLKGQPYRPTELLPANLRHNHEVWVIRTTGEVFLDYEMYLDKVRLYHEPIWSCSATERSGLTYLQAVMSENASKSKEVVPEKTHLEKLPPSLQMTLASPVMKQPMDYDLQLIGRFLRNEAKSTVAAMKPDTFEGLFVKDTENQAHDSKKRRSSGKDNEGKFKSDAKKIPGTVKHTIYETLKSVGVNGASISYLYQRLKDCKIQTSWADSSARNCIASLLNHDKAFVKLPKHGHYALALYIKAEESGNEKRELPSTEGDAPDYPRNNSRCLKCHKAKHPENSALVFCDQCPSAVHLACAAEYEQTLREITDGEETTMKFPYLCYKCVQKRKLAERQKVVRQKREEEKQKKQEERSQRQLDGHEKRKDNQDGRRRVYATKPQAARYPIEDQDLTADDHRHNEDLLNGPLLPELHEQPQVLLDALAVCEFLSTFGTELDDRLVLMDLTVAELMYSLCWPFDSSVLKNTYQALLKIAVHQTTKLSDPPPEARLWNATIDGYTWPEILRHYLRYRQENELVHQIEDELNKNGEETKLFLALSPKLHLKLLSTLVSYVSSSIFMRNTTDGRLQEAKRLESEIARIKKEMNKVKGKNATTAQTTKDNTNNETQGEQEGMENGDGAKRHLRRRGTTEESKEILVQNELAILEEKLERCRVRSDPLGLDRKRNEYFWFPSIAECLCVINAEKTTICCVRSKEELDRILCGLNQRGIREKYLMASLKAEYESMCHFFGEKEFSFNVDRVPRGVECFELEAFYKANKKQSRTPTEKLKQEHIAAALKTMVNRLHKIVGSVATVSDELQENIKVIRQQINDISSIESMRLFLSELKMMLRKVFQDGSEKQNSKTQLKLTAHLESFESGAMKSISELGLYVATLREFVEPLVRAKCKAMQSAAEAKRKRSDKSSSEKSLSSNDVAVAPSKKAKQKHDPVVSAEEEQEATDMLQFVAVPWRVTRSHARKGISATQLEVHHGSCSSDSTSSDDASESNRLSPSDDDYEEAEDSEDEEASGTNEEASCRYCGYGGRLIRCSGPNCDVCVHRGCIYGSKANEAQWCCSKCARTNRALYRNDRHL